LLDVHAPEKFLLIQVKPKNAVKAGGTQEQGALINTNFVAMTQIGISPGTDEFKSRRVGKQFVAGGYVNSLSIEGDTTQPPVPAAPLPVNVSLVPVYGLHDGSCIQVNQVDAAVALTLVAAPDNGCRDELGHGIFRDRSRLPAGQPS